MRWLSVSVVLVALMAAAAAILISLDARDKASATRVVRLDDIEQPTRDWIRQTKQRSDVNERLRRELAQQVDFLEEQVRAVCAELQALEDHADLNTPDTEGYDELEQVVARLAFACDEARRRP